MRTVEVNASGCYQIHIENGLLDRAGDYLRDVHAPCRAAVITDDVVDGLYAGRLCASLEGAGFSVCKFVFPNGETSKNVDTWARALTFLTENSLTRSDMIVALGGGVVGDLAGFAAACYLRGIPYIQIPTTFLAMIDSSVGGKTAVDLPAGKNLAGVFWQPKLVLCDPEALDTLPAPIFADGAAEAVKYGVLRGIDLFETLAGGDFCPKLPEIIERCVAIKRDFVQEDEFDTGVRQQLNLGHTIGHAIEKCSDYAISHGHAVAIGMAAAARAADMLGYSDEGCYIPIVEALRKNSLPTKCEYDSAALLRVIGSDKKRRGDRITWVIPRRIGKCALVELDAEQTRQFVAVGIGESHGHHG